MHCSRKSGFSLVELLIVIAIIVLLCALLLPILSKARARAQQSQCISNLHQFGVGLQNFLANDHGYMSYSAPDNDDHPRSWPWQLQTVGFGFSKGPQHWTDGVWRCPAAQFPPPAQPGGEGYGKLFL
jgi:prepilin-type N-terminal cleavage/methylation domain-containing protein